MKNITFLFLFIPLIYLSQVGINTKNPTETLDVNGTLRIRDISEIGSEDSARDSIMVFHNGLVKRVSANQIIKQADPLAFPRNIKNTGEQKLILNGNRLTLENGGTPIDLSPYVNTDKQKADVFKLEENTLKLSLENDGEEDKEVDLSKYLDNTDKQQISEFSYDKTTHQLTLEIKNGGAKKTIDLSSLATPKGAIIMWSGAIEDIPKGWQLCNGMNDTPDLRDRFIVGAGKSYKTKATGGKDRVTLTTNEMPKHNHGGNTSENGEHEHYYKDTLFIDKNLDKEGNFLGVSGVDHLQEGSDNRHVKELNNDGRDLYIYYRNIKTQKGGKHRHTINRAGGGKPHENRPPYYALAFIMFVGNE